MRTGVEKSPKTALCYVWNVTATSMHGVNKNEKPKRERRRMPKYRVKEEICGTFKGRRVWEVEAADLETAKIECCEGTVVSEYIDTDINDSYVRNASLVDTKGDNEATAAEASAPPPSASPAQAT